MGNPDASRPKKSPGKASNDKRRPTRSPAGRQPTSRQMASRRKAVMQQRAALIGGGCVLLAVLIVVLVFWLTGRSNVRDDGKILPNVYAAGIDLGGMTPEEARSALHLATDKTFSQTDMVVQLPGNQIRLSPADTSAGLDVDAVVDAAYGYGRGGSDEEYAQAVRQAEQSTHTIALLPYLSLDLDQIQATIQTFCDTYSSHMTQPEAHLEGDRPAYDPEYPDLEADHQTLVITMGQPDYILDTGSIYDRVLDAYSLNQMTVEYEPPTRSEPKRPVAAELFQQFCIAPANAVLDDVTFEATPEVYGYGFSIPVLQQMIDNAGYGETIQIQLDFLMPNVTVTELVKDLFRDSLATYTAANQSGNSTARDTNLRLSAEAINGIVIKDGETFSFNNVVGDRTPQKGYQQVSELRGGKETLVLGGGVSQTASALYYCALLADLDILERHNSQYATSYAPLGLDAYVDWGIQDLRFRNNTGAPVKIIAQANGSQVTVQLLGNDKLDYTIRIVTEVVETLEYQERVQIVDKDNILGYTTGQILQAGITGYEVQTSVDKLEKGTGTVLSSTLVDTSSYASRDQVVIALEPGPTDPTDPTDPIQPSDPEEPSEPSENTDDPSLPPGGDIPSYF